MTQKVNTGLLSLVAIVFTLQFNFPSVLSDFRVVGQDSHKVIFQTSSDFVRTGCGSFLNRSYLVVSDPLDACNVPVGPPSTGGPPTQTFFGISGSQNNQWILVTSGDGGCDLKTKFRNAARAGYSGVIVGTDEAHEDIVKPGLYSEDDEEFLDVHLVSSLDIQVLSKNYAYPKEYLVEPPSLSRCKEEYQKTWLRSRYLSMIRRAWKNCMEICWECAKWTLVIMGKLTIGIKSILPSVFHNRDTFSSIAISLASIVFSITVMMIISIQNTAKKLMKIKSTQKQEQTYEPKTSTIKDKEDVKSEGLAGDRKIPSSDGSSSPPRRPNFVPTSTTKNGIPIDYTLYHRINLDIKLNEPLTRARVNNAYRDMARKYHPDKNRHLNERELYKMTEEFRKKTKSRDILLQYCTS